MEDHDESYNYGQDTSDRPLKRRRDVNEEQLSVLPKKPATPVTSTARKIVSSLFPKSPLVLAV